MAFSTGEPIGLLRARAAFIICFMPNETKDVLKTSGELTPLKKKQKKKKKLSLPLRIGLKTLAISLFSVLMGINGQIIYNYGRYEKFYVNGESMYPTLNRYTKVQDANGNDVAYENIASLGDFVRPGYSYTCDYGLMDTSKETLSNLSRFDLVVTYYPSDMDFDEETQTYHPKEKNGVVSVSLKIKRIVGLPGETIKFDDNGDLFVYEEGKETPRYIDQPFLDEQEDWDESLTSWVKEAKTQTVYNAHYGTSSSPAKIEEGEYFLVGDNRQRNGSKDSREVGPIPTYCFVGKAIAVTAKCRYSISQDGLSSSQSLLLNSILMPWDIRFL